jgi:hypothetical protein
VSRELRGHDGYISQVSVHAKSDSYRKDDDAVLGIEVKPKLSLNWIDNETLSISCSDCDPKRIKGQEKRLGKFTIQYDFGRAKSGKT